jgi:hypothetical protein
MSTPRHVFVFDERSFTDFLKVMPLRGKEPEPEPFRMMVRYSPLFSIPVIRSPYIFSGYEPPPSIINDFDRWFREARFRVEGRKMAERERQYRVLASAWRE